MDILCLATIHSWVAEGSASRFFEGEKVYDRGIRAEADFAAEAGAECEVVVEKGRYRWTSGSWRKAPCCRWIGAGEEAVVVDALGACVAS